MQTQGQTKLQILKNKPELEFRLLRVIKYLTVISQKLLAILFPTKKLASVAPHKNILEDPIDLFRVTLVYLEKNGNIIPVSRLLFELFEDTITLWF
jgi:hypothetical protein